MLLNQHKWIFWIFIFIVFSIPALAVTNYTYTYADYSIKGHMAWDSNDAGAKPPATLVVPNENQLSAAEYLAISTSNDTRASISNPILSTRYLTYRFMFNLSQNRLQIKHIYYLWEGYDDTAGARPVNISIWNYTGSKWQNFNSSSASSDADVTLNTNAIYDFVNSTNQINFLVETQAPALTAHTLYTDFTRLIIEADTQSPVWSNQLKNQTIVYQNDTVYFNTTWTDDVNLSTYIFSIDQTGSWAISTVPFGGTTNLSINITKITAVPGTLVRWYFWANDTSGNYNQTDQLNFTVSSRSVPVWSNPQKNETNVYYGDSVLFNASWNSTWGLSAYVFSINQTGSWVNSSAVAFGGLNNFSTNVSTITALPGTNVQWYFWVNDTYGGFNQTPVQNFTVQYIIITDNETIGGVSDVEALVFSNANTKIWNITLSSAFPQVDVTAYTNYSKYGVGDDWNIQVNKTYLGNITDVTSQVTRNLSSKTLVMPKTNLSNVTFTITAGMPTVPNATPIIFIGGTINFINDTYPADFTFSFPDYPYVKTNSTNKFDFYYTHNGSAITDGTVNFMITNITQSLIYSSIYGSYALWLHFNETESGDFLWDATANRSGYSNSNLTGILIVRDYVKVKVKLWQDCTWYQFWCGWFNPDNQANYKNRFGYVIATPVPDDRMARANYSWNKQLQPLADLAIWGNKKLMDNVTGLYRVSNKAFSVPYSNGQAVLFLPANETYALEFMAGKMAWDNPTGYGAGYYSKKYTESILLDGIKPVAGLDYNLEYKVTNYELHKSSIWLFWIVFGGMIFLLLIFAGFVIAFDPAKGVIMLMVILLLSPVIWLVLKLVFWIIYM